MNLLDIFKNDVAVRATQKLATMTKVAERDGEEAEFQPTWFESLANSAPVSALLDMADNSGLSDFMESTNNAIGTTLGDFANSIIPDSQLAAAEKAQQDNDDWIHSQEFRNLRNRNRLETANVLERQDRIKNLLANGYQNEPGALDQLKEMLALKGRINYTLDPANLNMSSPDSFLKELQESMNKTDLSEGYSQLKHRILNGIDDVKTQASTLGKGLMGYLQDANDLVSNNIQNIPDMLGSIFKPLAQPTIDTGNSTINTLKSLYGSAARGADNMIDREDRQQNLQNTLKTWLRGRMNPTLAERVREQITDYQANPADLELRKPEALPYDNDRATADRMVLDYMNRLKERQRQFEAEAERRSGNKFTKGVKSVQNSYNDLENSIKANLAVAEKIAPMIADDADKKAKRTYLGVKNKIDQNIADATNNFSNNFSNMQDTLDNAFYRDNAISQFAENATKYFYNDY